MFGVVGCCGEEGEEVVSTGRGVAGDGCLEVGRGGEREVSERIEVGAEVDEVGASKLRGCAVKISAVGVGGGGTHRAGLMRTGIPASTHSTVWAR